jgi:putative endonuclease
MRPAAFFMSRLGCEVDCFSRIISRMIIVPACFYPASRSIGADPLSSALGPRLGARRGDMGFFVRHAGVFLPGIQDLGFVYLKGGELSHILKIPAIYILSSKKNGTLYIGVTRDLQKRIWQHKNDIIEGFTKRYRIHILVYFEIHKSMKSAIHREKQLKEWKRSWKLKLIESANPYWRDLYFNIVD